MHSTHFIKKILAVLIPLVLFNAASLFAQPLMETGGGPMPKEWIDRDTHHKIIKLVQRSGINLSFYFHNNPFVGNTMVFYGSNEKQQEKYKDELKHKAQEIYNMNVKDKQLYTVNLDTKKVEQLTHHGTSFNGEIVSASTNKAFYQSKDSVFSVDLNTKKESLVFVFPEDFKANITTVNANGTLLAGAWSTDVEKEISRQFPEKHDYFKKIFESKLPRTLFTIDIKTKSLHKIFTDSAWLNHIQFSTTDPNLLMFCHEGTWEKVDRIWTIDVVKKEQPKLIHARTIDMEIAGHEWFSSDGRFIWYDLQLPRGKKFYVGGTELATGKEVKYELQRNDWSVHYTSSWDQKFFAGDGGDLGAVAKAPDGQWINLFTPDGDHFSTQKLVNMKHHNYHLEPNVHFSPDGKWIIFRANFEGYEDIYAVEIAPYKS